MLVHHTPEIMIFYPQPYVSLNLLCLLCLFYHSCNFTPSKDSHHEPRNYFPPPDTIILSQMEIRKELQEQWVNYTQGIPLDNNQFTPVNQAALNPYFASFLEELFTAIDNRDSKFLLHHVDENIQMSYGIKQGKEAFIENWNLARNPQDSRIWQQLDAILTLGGIFTNRNLNSFTAPYTFFILLEDPYQQIIVTGTDVRIRSQPGLNGEVLGSLNHEVVELVPLAADEQRVIETIGLETHAWEKIKTANGTIGYVYGKYLRSPTDFRTNFEYQNGTWMMRYFISGD